jgi:uncharacterized membrane protein
MRTIVIAYLATAVIFFAVDFVWPSTAVDLLYVLGVLAFAVMPPWRRATGPARSGAAPCSAWSPTT